MKLTHQASVEAIVVLILGACEEPCLGRDLAKLTKLLEKGLLKVVRGRTIDT
jgi:hypothetical protein